VGMRVTLHRGLASRSECLALRLSHLLDDVAMLE
jgi:hypothetical protein